MINIMIEKFLFINVLLKNNSLIYHLTTIIKAKYYKLNNNIICMQCMVSIMR